MTGDLWGLVTRSRIRRETLRLLESGDRELREVKEALETSHTSTLTPEIKKLKERGLVEEYSVPHDGSYRRMYQLTTLGEIVTGYLKELLDSVDAVEGNMEFWRNHSVEGIPREFRERFHQLSEGEVVHSDSTDVDRPMQRFFDELSKSERLRGYSPIFREELVHYFLEKVEEGVPCSVILSEGVFEKLVGEHGEETSRMISGESAEFFVCEEELDIAFTVTDRVLSFGLYDRNGRYDTSAEFICSSPEALDWGEDLFDYVRERSHPVEA